MGAEAITVRLLGPVMLEGPAGPIPTRSAFLRTLLALLSLRPGSVIGVSDLIDDLWGEALPQDPKGALQIQATRLRKWFAAAGLDDVAVRNEHDGYVLALPSEQIDLHRFLDIADTALGMSNPESSLAAIVSGMELWRGEPFAGCALPLRLEGERVRADERRLQLVERRCEAQLERGDNASALADLSTHLKLHRSRERLTVLAMTALHRAGRQRDALEEYAETRRHLAEEFGLDPGSDLRATEARVLQQSMDLDHHSATPAQAVRNPVKEPRPMIVGRDAELAVIEGHLEDPGVGRIVIVQGEAGVGKSTILHAARHDAAARGAVTALGAWDDDGAPLGAWEEVLSDLGLDRGVLSEAHGMSVGRSVRTSLAQVALEAPVLVGLDDAHHADGMSLGVIRALARLGLPPRVVVVITVRSPDAVPHVAWASVLADIARTPTVDLLAVRELTTDAAVGLARSRLRSLPLDAAERIGAELWTRTSGHPLHLSALLDVVKDIADEAACLEAADEVPPALQPLLDHQLSRLPPKSREIVEAIAVFGPSSLDDVAQPLGIDPIEVARRLRPAVELGIVVDRDDRVHLRHALMMTSILGSTPSPVRRQLHRARYADLAATASEPFEVLRHAIGSGALVDIADLARARSDAGRAAYVRGAHDDAVELLTAALDDLPADQRVVAQLHLGLALAALGRAAEADDLFDGVIATDAVPIELAALAAVGHEPLGLRVAGDERRLRRLQRVSSWPLHDLTARIDLLRALVIEEALVHGEVHSLAASEELAELVTSTSVRGNSAQLARIRLMEAREAVDHVAGSDARLLAAERAHEVAVESDDPHLVLDATELLMSAALAAGQVDRCHDLRWVLSREADRVNRPRSRWAARIVEAALLLAEGSDESADAIAAEALNDGLNLGIPDAMGAYGVHVVTRDLLRGDLGSDAALIDQAVAGYPHIAAWSAAAAVASIHRGANPDAGTQLAEFVARRAVHGPGYFDRPGLCMAACASFALDDEMTARVVLEALQPEPSGVVVVGVGASIFGPVDLFVAMAEAVVGERDAARRHAADAQQLARSLDWRPWEVAATELVDTIEGTGRSPLGLWRSA